MPPATPATRRPDRRRCSVPHGGRHRRRRGGTGLVTLSSSHGPGECHRGRRADSQGVPDVGARGPDQSESHERFGRAHHAAGHVGNPPRSAAGRPADRRRRLGDRAPLRHRPGARPGRVRRRGLLRHRRGALHRRLGAASRRARYRSGRSRPTASQGVAADPARDRGRGRASAGCRTRTAGCCCRSRRSPRCCSCCTAAAAAGGSPGRPRPGRPRTTGPPSRTCRGRPRRAAR